MTITRKTGGTLTGRSTVEPGRLHRPTATQAREINVVASPADPMYRLTLGSEVYTTGERPGRRDRGRLRLAVNGNASSGFHAIARQRRRLHRLSVNASTFPRRCHVDTHAGRHRVATDEDDDAERQPWATADMELTITPSGPRHTQVQPSSEAEATTTTGPSWPRTCGGIAAIAGFHATSSGAVITIVRLDGAQLLRRAERRRDRQRRDRRCDGARRDAHAAVRLELPRRRLRADGHVPDRGRGRHDAGATRHVHELERGFTALSGDADIVFRATGADFELKVGHTQGTVGAGEQAGALSFSGTPTAGDAWNVSLTDRAAARRRRRAAVLIGAGTSTLDQVVDAVRSALNGSDVPRRARADDQPPARDAPDGRHVHDRALDHAERQRSDATATPTRSRCRPGQPTDTWNVTLETGKVADRQRRHGERHRFRARGLGQTRATPPSRASGTAFADNDTSTSRRSRAVVHAVAVDTPGAGFARHRRGHVRRRSTRTRST